METIEQAIYRVLYREPEKYDEFLQLYANLKRQGGIRSQLFPLLCEAMYAKHTQATEFLWREILIHNLSVKEEKETLLTAAYMGNIWIIQQLVSGGMDISHFNHPVQDSPLTRAAERCQLETVKFLLDMCNYQEYEITRALCAACEAPEMNFVSVEKVAPVVKVLLEAGADPYGGSKSPIWNNMIDTGYDDDEESALLLLEYAHDESYFPYIYQLAICMPRLLEALIARGVRGDDITIENEEAMTLLMLAIFDEEIEAVRILLKHGVNLEARDANGKTALDYALHTKRQDIIELLQNYSTTQATF